MRKQARRLWFGDWQRDPEHADTVTIVPPGEEDVPVRDDRARGVRRGAILAALAVFCVAVLLLSSGGGDKNLTSERSGPPPAQAPQAQPQVPQPQTPQGGSPQGFGGPDLSGAAAVKAAQAAVAKYPGSVERVTADSTGRGYVVHVIQPDGNEVHVLVDGGFHVRGSDAGGGPRSLGPGTPQ